MSKVEYACKRILQYSKCQSNLWPIEPDFASVKNQVSSITRKTSKNRKKDSNVAKFILWTEEEIMTYKPGIAD